MLDAGTSTPRERQTRREAGAQSLRASNYERWPGYRTAVGPRVGPSPRVGGREPHPYAVRKEWDFTLFIVDPHQFIVGHLEVS
jgi:hypothetical protein